MKRTPVLTEMGEPKKKEGGGWGECRKKAENTHKKKKHGKERERERGKEAVSVK